MAGGGSVEFHHCGILHPSFSLDMGGEIWCSFCYHFELWNTVYVLRMDRSRLIPGDFSVNYYQC